MIKKQQKGRLYFRTIRTECVSKSQASFWPDCGPPFFHWLPCSHPILTDFPTGPIKVLPCPNGSHISNQFLARGVLIALMMEATSTSETSETFYHTTQRNMPEDSIFGLHIAFLQFVTCHCMSHAYSVQSVPAIFLSVCL
jgi:hypothetical protein